jgi:hypothetical protein
MLTDNEIKYLKKKGFIQIKYSHFPNYWFASNGSRWTEQQIKEVFLGEVKNEKVLHDH